MVRLSQVRYDSGLADYFEVLYSMQLLFPAEIALARARLDLLSDYVDIYKALGGGWNLAEPDLAVARARGAAAARRAIEPQDPLARRRA